MTPLVDIAGLRGLVERATPGEWHSDPCARGFEVYTANCETVAVAVVNADARFIAAARTAVPALCDRVEELERENARLRADLAMFHRANGQDVMTFLTPEEWERVRAARAGQ